jgi:hypothetical protein
MTPYTYYLIHKATGKKYYGVKYGASADPTKFWVENGYFTSSLSIQQLVSDEGPDAFVAEVRKIFSTVDDAVRWEQAVLKRMRAVKRDDWFNMALGTGPYINNGPFTPEEKERVYKTRRGRTMSPEHRRKISEAHKGKKKPRTPEWQDKITQKLTGQVRAPHSEEIKQKISKANKGKPSKLKGTKLSQETIDKIKQAKKDNPYQHTEEFKRNLSARVSGENHPLFGVRHSDEARLKISRKMGGKILVVKHSESGIIETIVGSRKEFCEKYNISSGNLSYLIQGKSKSCNGWILLEVRELD